MNEISIYPIVPASGRVIWVLLPALLAVVALVFLLVGIAFSTKKTRFEISPEELRIRGDLYGRAIRKEMLAIEDAAVLDLGREIDWRPQWRTNGTAFPGYQSGWFRLRNKEKALLFVTDREKVVKLPTRDGYTLLFSVSEPEAFLAEARKKWRGDNSEALGQ